MTLPAVMNTRLPINPNTTRMFPPMDLPTVTGSLGEPLLVQYESLDGEVQFRLYCWTGISWCPMAVAFHDRRRAGWSCYAKDLKRNRLLAAVQAERSEAVRWMRSNARPRDVWLPVPEETDPCASSPSRRPTPTPTGGARNAVAVSSFSPTTTPAASA